MGELVSGLGNTRARLSDVGTLEPRAQDLEMIERTRAARDLLSSKWKVDLLYLLARGVHRYSRLYDNLRGASKKMLTDSLRGLERDGFVERNVYAEVPVRVEYSLTALGWSATELLMALADWADEHLAAVEQARLRYRQTAAATRSVADRRAPGGLSRRGRRPRSPRSGRCARRQALAGVESLRRREATALTARDRARNRTPAVIREDPGS